MVGSSSTQVSLFPGRPRWRVLLDALHGEDRAAQRWAEHELALALPEDSRVDEASPEEIWTPEYIAQLEAACA